MLTWLVIRCAWVRHELFSRLVSATPFLPDGHDVSLEVTGRRKTRPSAASHTLFGLALGWEFEGRSLSRGGRIPGIFPSRFSCLPSAYRSERAEGVPVPPEGNSLQRQSDPDTFETLLRPPCPDATTSRLGHGHTRDRASRRPRIEEGASRVRSPVLFGGARRLSPDFRDQSQWKHR